MRCGKRTAVTMRWIGHAGFEPSGPGASATAGPMYPVPETEFQKPFIVLGGTLNAASNHQCVESIRSTSPPVPWLIIVGWFKAAVYGAGALSSLLQRR